MNKKIIIFVLVLAIPLTLSAFPGNKINGEGHSTKKVERLTTIVQTVLSY
ncbi:hypothetical protein [Methylobacter sp. S3L5C]|nr:hypothetical protein [Methylobacter sp. S3L5C]UOA08653.1 hypothetical protein KKZ03_21100 [Methylobacter sp. S3L5C]